MPREVSTKDQSAIDFLRNIPRGTVFVTQLIQKDQKKELQQIEESTFTQRSRPKENTSEQYTGYRHLLYPETGPFAHADSRKPRRRRGEQRATLYKSLNFGGSVSGGLSSNLVRHSALDYTPRFLDELQLSFFESRGPIPHGCLFHPLTSEEDRRQANNAYAHLLPSKGPDGEPTGMSLTKIQALKCTALELSTSRGWEESTVALGFVAFERCVLGGFVNKANRRRSMAVCLLLAWKMNESRERSKSEGQGGGKEVASTLAASYRERRGAILAEEFDVFVQLQFALHVDTQQIQPHLDRLVWAVRGEGEASAQVRLPLSPGKPLVG